MKALIRSTFPGPWRKARGCWHATRCLLRGDVHWAREYFGNGFREHQLLSPIEFAYFQNLGTAARRASKTLSLVDVGASDGFFTAGLARFYKPKRAICYEPLPEGWPSPDPSRLGFPVEFRRAAVGASRGEIELHRYKCTGLASTLPLVSGYQYAFDTSLQETVTRPVVSLTEDLHPQLDDLAPFMLKIDTQGYELEVLKGALSLLTPAVVPVITLEAMARTKYDGQAKLHELIAFLGDRGYQVFDISRGYREPATGQHSEYDLTFCHQDLLTC